ncbi:MAG: DUF3577 domain-containing protein [Chromatiaceae bacterium]|nr:DUF3577 domain-containing protein [Chromatiaceae bacterium]
MTQTETKYFDLHIQGIGYLNRVREVKPTRAEPFWATDIAAIFGSADNVQRTRFDCRVVGAEAQRVIAHAKKHVDGERKVLSGTPSWRRIGFGIFGGIDLSIYGDHIGNAEQECGLPSHVAKKIGASCRSPYLSSLSPSVDRNDSNVVSSDFCASDMAQRYDHVSDRALYDC